jgi:Holliday junction DNA helicase RuvA
MISELNPVAVTFPATWELDQNTLEFSVIGAPEISYEAICPVSSFARVLGDMMPKLDQHNSVTADYGYSVFFHHYFTDREGPSIYGFPTRLERALFRRMICVSGIGPKKALAILSRTNYETIWRLIRTGDRESFSNLPGTGKKAKFGPALIAALFDADIPQPELPKEKAPSVVILNEEAVLGLMGLGYKQVQSRETVRAVMEKNPGEDDTAKIIVAALRLLNPK